MTREFTVQEFVEQFKAGEFESKDFDTQCKAGWFDWFCKTESLARKLKPLGTFVKQIVDSEKFDKHKTYVFFKNNCPLIGPLYDSLSICDTETGDVLFWVGFNDKRQTKGTTEVVKVNGHGDVETVFVGNKREAVKWFLKEGLQ